MQPCPSRCALLRLMGQALRFAARPLGSHKGRLCLAPRPTARAAALPLHFNCALVRARAARQHGYLLRRCAQGWRNDPRPPRPPRYAGSQLTLARSPLACLPSHPLAGRISRLHTRDRSAGARHAVRNPCYTPQGAPCCVCGVQKQKTRLLRCGHGAPGFCLAAKERRLPFVYLSINCTACAAVTMAMPW